MHFPLKLDSAAQLGFNCARTYHLTSSWQKESGLTQWPIRSKIARGLSGGATLEVLATDPGAVPDFEAFCKTGGHELLEHSREGEVFRFLIRIADGV